MSIRAPERLPNARQWRRFVLGLFACWFLVQCGAFLVGFLQGVQEWFVTERVRELAGRQHALLRLAEDHFAQEGTYVGLGSPSSPVYSRLEAIRVAIERHNALLPLEGYAHELVIQTTPNAFCASAVIGKTREWPLAFCVNQTQGKSPVLSEALMVRCVLRTEGPRCENNLLYDPPPFPTGQSRRDALLFPGFAMGRQTVRLLLFRSQ